MGSTPSFVGIICTHQKVLGTGFIVDPEGELVVTAAHVVSRAIGAKDALFFQLFGSNQLHEIAPLAHHSTTDIALFQASQPISIDPSSVKLVTEVRPSDDVWIVGYTEEENVQREYKSAQGKFMGPTMMNGVELFEIEMQAVYKGMSGAPVMVGNNGVIGVQTDRASDRGFAGALVVPISYVAALDERVQTKRTKYLQGLIQRLRKQQRKLFDFVECYPTMAQLPGNRSEPKRVFDLVDEQAKILLVGPAGSGKSTILRELAIRVALSALKDPHHGLPVFVDLYHWGSSTNSFEKFIREALEQESFLRPGDDLYDLLAERRFLLYLDTIDELDFSHIRLLSDWVEKVDARLVLTSRDYRFLGLDSFSTPVASLQTLDMRTVFEFAQSFFGDAHLADDFVTSLGAANSSYDSWFNLNSELAGNPFFLSAALESHRQHPHQSLKATHGQEFTQWSVVESIFKQMWHAPRVVQRLSMSRSLQKKYHEPHEIIRLLSSVSNHVQMNVLEKVVAEKLLDAEMLEVLGESNILTFDSNDDTYRFPHLLFVDFLRAYGVDLDNIDDYLLRYEYRQALTLLATRGEKEREVIQSALLIMLEENSRATAIFGSDWIFDTLGAIGDEQAIDVIMKVQPQAETREYNRSSYHRSIALAKIANRLTDENPHKRRVIQFLQSRIEIVREWPVDINGEILYELGFPLGPFGDYLEAAEALSHIRSLEALDAILEVLDLSARYLHDKPNSGGWLRENWFAQYISNLGGWTVPRLLEAIYSDHPDVSTTIAIAILKLNRASDAAQLGRVLLSHPHHPVRAYLAIALGERRFPEAVPYLCAAIGDDGYWAMSGIGFRTFRFVADHVAQALAEIGTFECRRTLIENQYDERGGWTDQLLVSRLEDFKLDSEIQQPWVKLQIAGNLAARDRIDLLLLRMGHVERQIASGFRIVCPIAAQLIRRYNMSRPSEGEAPQLKDYRDITGDLIEFIETTSDAISARWALFVLGLVGNETAYRFLREYVAKGTLAASDGAAYGLGGYVARNLRDLDISQIEEACDLLDATLDRSRAEAYGGVSCGFSRIIGSCLAANLDVITQRVRSSLLQRIEAGSVAVSKAALDALEVVCVENEGFIDDTIQALLNASPSYYSRLGESDFAENERKETIPLLRPWVDYGNTLSLYRRALNAKQASDAWWRSKYTENDWRDLGCGDGHLYYRIGRLLIVGENWSDALEALHKSCSSIAAYDIPSDAEKSIYLHSMLEIGNIAARFLEVPEVAGHYHSAAVEFALNLPRHNWTKELARTFLHSMSNHQGTLRQFGRHDQVIAVGQLSLRLLQWAGTIDAEAMADIYVNIHQSASALHDAGTAKSAIEKASELLIRSPRRSYRASTILAKAETLQAMDPSVDIQADATEVRYYFERRGVPLMVAKADYILAKSAEHAGNHADALRWYQDALAVLETSDDSDAATQRVTILHRLALIHQSEGRYDLSNSLFEDSFGAIQRSDQVPDFVTHVIRSDHAKLLHLMGHHDRAVDELLTLLQERAELGMGPGYPDEVLSEIDAVPGCTMPAVMANNLVDAVIHALDGTVPALAVNLHLMTVLFALDEDEQHAEWEFVQALHGLLHGDEINMPVDSPFHPYVLRVKSTIQ